MEKLNFHCIDEILNEPGENRGPSITLRPYKRRGHHSSKLLDKEYRVN